MVHQVEQEQGGDEGEMKKRTAYLGCGRSGFQDLVAAQTPAGDGAPPQSGANWLISRLQPLDVAVSWPRFPVRNDAVGGDPRAMMMWYGGMGRYQCTCESCKLVPTKQANVSFLFPLGAYPLPHLLLFRCRHGSKAAYSSKQCFKLVERSYSQRKSSQPDASQISHRSSILRLNPALQHTCPPLALTANSSNSAGATKPR
jgi:hypothetical protein